jgi:signal transduction histidine kinase
MIARRRCAAAAACRRVGERMTAGIQPTDRLNGAADGARWQEQLESLYAISVEIATLRQLDQVMDRALDYCLQLTESQFGFVGLINDSRFLDVAAIKGFAPHNPTFWERFRRIPIRPSVFGIVVIEGRPNRSNDVLRDPYHVGSPVGHPPVHTFLGVPLTVGQETIGMIGVANRRDGYRPEHERLLATFANQVAVAIANARLYEQQQAMIADLQSLQHRLDAAKVTAMIHQDRTRIAEELHDRVAQILFSIGMAAAWCLEHRPPNELAQALERVKELAARGTDEIRRVVYDLTGNTPRAGGLCEELRDLIAAVSRTSHLQLDLIVDGRVSDLPREVEEALERVVLEALTNVQRHSAADVALVSLCYEPDQVVLVVQDNGVGVPPLVLAHAQHHGSHLGLKGMQRRIEAVGGRLTLVNGEDGGLIVRATVPIRARQGER